MSRESNRRILIVDDQWEIHEDFKRILSGDAPSQDLNRLSAGLFGDAVYAPESISFEVASALQGKEGLALVEQALTEKNPFALAFVDIRMPPGWDGIETIQQLWHVDPELQIVICTAFSDYNLDKITQTLGKSDRLLILKKPFDVIEVRQLAYALTEKWNLALKAEKALKALNRQNELLDELVAERTRQIESVNAQLREEVEQRRLMEERLLESDSLYRMLTTHMTDLVAACDQNARLTYVSPSYRTILGYRPQELLGEPILKLVIEDDLDHVRQIISNGRDSLRPAFAVYRMRHKEGHELWFETVGKVVFDPEGQPLGAVFNTREITARKEMEDRLRESEARYRLLAENIKDVIWVRDLTTMQFTYISPSIEEASGYTVEEAMNLTYEQTLTPASVQKVQSAFVEQMMLEQDPNSDPDRSLIMILESICKDGSTLWNEVHASFVRDSNGQPVAMVGISRDITDRKKAEEALHESEEKYRLHFANLNDVIYSVDWKGVVLNVSPSVKRLLGYDPEELIGRPFTELNLLTEESMIRAISDTGRVFSGENIDASEYEFIAKDGKIRYGEVSGSPIVVDGRVVATSSIARDVTDRKKVEDALRESEERFRMLAENSTDLVWIMSMDGRFTYLSPSIENVSGFSVEEGLAFTMESILSPESYVRCATMIGGELAKPPEERARSLRMELQQLNKKGDYFDIEITTAWIYDDRGNPAGIQGITRDITARKRAEKALRDSEEAYRSLAEHSLQGLIVVSGMEIVFANQTFADIVGYSRDEVLGLSWATIVESIHPDDRPMVLQRLKDRMEGKPVPDHYEYRIFRKDGALRWVEVKAAAVEFRGQVSNQVSYIDVTERKAAEQALRDSEARYRLLAENSTDMVWAMNLDGSYIYASPSVEAITGYSPEELVQKTTFERLTPESGEKALQILAEELAKPSDQRAPSLTLEMQHRKKNGGVVDIEVNTGWIVDGNGIPIGIQGISRDITERKNAEKALRESEEKFRSIGTSALDAVIMIGREGDVLFWNPAAEHMFGYSEQEAAGQNLHNMIMPEIYSEQFTAGFAAFQSTGRGEAVGRTLELTGKRRDGTEFPVEISVSPIRFQNSFGAVATVRDITRRKAAEQEKEHLEEQLRQSQKMEAIGRLAGGVAHDFNNILTGIIGYAEMLLTTLGPGDPIYGDIEEIYRAGERAAGLTAQLLAFSRKQIISPKIVQLNDAIANAQKMLARLIGEDIDLVFHPAADLGTITIDPAQVDQILINLAANARDAMPNGGRLTIETSRAVMSGEKSLVRGIEITGDFVLLTISDDGFGMDEETLEHIFEPFFSTKGKHEGTGLGLATVYGIVKQNNGYILVDSSPGAGTTFRIYFPDAGQAHVQEPRSARPKLPVGTETILLVEDEEMVRGLARKILTSQGYQVLEAKNGGEALLICEAYSNQIHLLLTDVIMPKMNGRELYERLRLIRPGLRVLFMSGYTEDVIAHHGVLEADIPFLQKPFTIESLAKKIREILT